MAVDLRKEHECRIELHKHLKNNEILYGEISPNLLITISDFLLEWDGKNVNTSERQLTIPVVSKRYLITFYSSSRAIGFEIKIYAKDMKEAENKARDMNSSAYFTIDEIRNVC